MEAGTYYNPIRWALYVKLQSVSIHSVYTHYIPDQKNSSVLFCSSPIWMTIYVDSFRQILTVDRKKKHCR